MSDSGVVAQPFPKTKKPDFNPLGQGTMQNAPRKLYRLRDGTTATEYEAFVEVLKHLEAQRLHLDERIEETKRRLEMAEGAP